MRVSYADEIKAQARLLVEHLRVQRISCLYQDDAFGREGLGRLRAVLDSVGMSVSEAAPYAPGSADVGAAADALLRPVHKPQAVVLVAQQSAAAQFIRVAKDDPRGDPRCVFVVLSVAAGADFPAAGVDIIVTTLPGWGWGGGGGVEPGGSDDGMTITICTFFALQVCVFAELDESAAALPPGFCTPFLAVSSQIVPHSPLRFFSLSQDIKCNFVPPCCLQKYHGFSPLLRSCYQHKCGCENCKQ